LEDRIDLVVEEAPRTDGVGLAVGISVVLHVVLAIYIAATYKPVGSEKVTTPILRYVELMRKNPTFTEAPGQKVKAAPINAAFSDANRKASMPEPTGPKPTKTPGEGSTLYHPPTGSPSGQREAPQQQPVAPQQAQDGSQSQQSSQQATTSATAAAASAFHQQPVQASSGAINWSSAIKEVGKIASLGGKQGIDLGQPGGGGEKGYAESGPISFESQWFDWGEYAEGMVRRIRVNWDANMPQLIRTGMKGHLTIRFTIHRDGHLTDVTILQGSGVPPYDFAAKKAIELSSPLSPLPKEFPNETERVTCMFFYNEEPPAR
jgi:TonB family protein